MNIVLGIMLSAMIAQLIALGCMVAALILLIRSRLGENPRFRIEKIAFHDSRTLYYPQRRYMFNRWKGIEIEPGVRGYFSIEEAQGVLEQYLTDLGLEMSESEVVKEYG